MHTILHPLLSRVCSFCAHYRLYVPDENWTLNVFCMFLVCIHLSLVYSTCTLFISADFLPDWCRDGVSVGQCGQQRPLMVKYSTAFLGGFGAVIYSNSTFSMWRSARPRPCQNISNMNAYELFQSVIPQWTTAHSGTSGHWFVVFLLAKNWI